MIIALASLTRVLGEVGVTITVEIILRARGRRQGTVGIKPDVGVRVSDPVGDWRLGAELLANGGIAKMYQYLKSETGWPAELKATTTSMSCNYSPLNRLCTKRVASDHNLLHVREESPVVEVLHKSIQYGVR